ncbi:gag-pol polyprotein [Tanacetum coccineum]|uniref:Gag-pol polyprotein n=1 Tax=Tanacetum coccineum TaxID=301880 RepID=A0ABQ4XMS4_9ASTR
MSTLINNSQMHNDIMIVGLKERLPMLALEVPVEGDDPGQPCVVREETYVNTTLENRKLIDDETKEFGKFTLRDEESIKSYYIRFYKMMNEMVRDQLKVDNMQVNVQFLQQLQPKWSRFVIIVKQQQDLDTVSYHKLFDIMKQNQNKVNEIRAKKIVRNANPLALVSAAQHYPDDYAQALKPYKTHAHSSRQTTSTITCATTRNKGKEIIKPISPPSENKNVDISPRNRNDRQTRQFRNQRTIAIVGNQENVGNQVVQQSGIYCYNCKGFGHFVKECKKLKRVKDYEYHKEKMMLCKQESKEKGEDHGFDSNEDEVVPKVEDVSLVDGVFDGALGGDGDEDIVIGEGEEEEEKCDEDDEENDEGDHYLIKECWIVLENHSPNSSLLLSLPQVLDALPD